MTYKTKTKNLLCCTVNKIVFKLFNLEWTSEVDRGECRNWGDICDTDTNRPPTLTIIAVSTAESGVCYNKPLVREQCFLVRIKCYSLQYYLISLLCF